MNEDQAPLPSSVALVGCRGWPLTGRLASVGMPGEILYNRQEMAVKGK